MPTGSPARRPKRSKPQAIRRPEARSKISNGRVLVPGVDQRSTWVRRCRDLIELHLRDLGGRDACSESERSIVRRAACLTIELERLEQKFALAGEAPVSAADVDLYQRTANSLRRLLESVGIERRPRDITPSLNDYLRQRGTNADAEAAA